jgi:hypothetical protein
MIWNIVYNNNKVFEKVLMQHRKLTKFIYYQFCFGKIIYEMGWNGNLVKIIFYMVKEKQKNMLDSTR